MSAPSPDSEREAELDRFLRLVQRRALTAARLSVPYDEALDCVQSAMLRFVRNYRRKSPDEWRPLFFRVLYNRLRDWHRRRAVRDAFVWLAGAEDRLQAESPQPDRWLAAGDAGANLIDALQRLPLRQQAFILRHWEGLDTAATARAMGVNEGTVKTHLSRAVQRLRQSLEAHYEPGV